MLPFYTPWTKGDIKMAKNEYNEYNDIQSIICVLLETLEFLASISFLSPSSFPSITCHFIY